MARRNLEFILLVEDDPDIRAMVKLSLEAMGSYKVRVASSGAAAFEAVAEHVPDLILLDVMMPGMDGTRVLKTLRKRPSLSQTPMVFMTAKAQPTELDSYRALGAADVIVKPFDPMTLADRIEGIWTRFLAERESP